MCISGMLYAPLGCPCSNSGIDRTSRYVHPSSISFLASSGEMRVTLMVGEGVARRAPPVHSRPLHARGASSHRAVDLGDRPLPLGSPGDAQDPRHARAPPRAALLD